jgi:hypothetical protein
VVERGTISATDSWSGTLGHGTPLTVTAGTEGRRGERAEEQGTPAIVTRLVEQGETVKRGDELYRVNEQPVTLLRGAVPMYRDLGVGDTGVDVKQLEENLAELGYDRLTVDREYAESTAEVVRAWQDDIGAEQTATVARAPTSCSFPGAAGSTPCTRASATR